MRYQIARPIRRLKGLSFRSFLIKQVVVERTAPRPKLPSFVTLSPAPTG